MLYAEHEFVYEGRFITGGFGPPNPIINVKTNPIIRPVKAP